MKKNSCWTARYINNGGHLLVLKFGAVSAHALWTRSAIAPFRFSRVRSVPDPPTIKRPLAGRQIKRLVPQERPQHDFLVVHSSTHSLIRGQFVCLSRSCCWWGEFTWWKTTLGWRRVPCQVGPGSSPPSAVFRHFQSLHWPPRFGRHIISNDAFVGYTWSQCDIFNYLYFNVTNTL